ncbi:MAG: helix-turn-helix domain-containing protein [Pseudomonadota bacterium]
MQAAPAHAGLPADICQSVGDVLARVGDKWSLLVIYMLTGRAMRFSELKRSLGSISQKVLTTTLRGLERDGYLTRTVTPSIPPRVDYELTPLGREALEPVAALATWAMSRRTDIEAARAVFDEKSLRP